MYFFVLLNIYSVFYLQKCSANPVNFWKFISKFISQSLRVIDQRFSASCQRRTIYLSAPRLVNMRKRPEYKENFDLRVANINSDLEHARFGDAYRHIKARSEAGSSFADAVRGFHHRMRQTSQGSFSAVSRRNFASKYAFESSRRDLHKAVLCTALNSHF